MIRCPEAFRARQARTRGSSQVPDARATGIRHCAGPLNHVSRTMTSVSRISNPGSRGIIVGATVILGVAAIALIFAPIEVARAVGVADPAAMAIPLQLYGAALFGLAMTGWMVKDAIVGGVFGRSYVVGNAGHAFVGAFALTRPALAPGATPSLWAISGVYWLLALTFGYLMFVAAPRSRQG